MKKVVLTILIIALVVLFGTWPLSVLSKIFEFIGGIVGWLAKVLDFFSWNGLLK